MSAPQQLSLSTPRALGRFCLHAIPPSIPFVHGSSARAEIKFHLVSVKADHRLACAVLITRSVNLSMGMARHGLFLAGGSGGCMVAPAFGHLGWSAPCVPSQSDSRPAKCLSLSRSAIFWQEHGCHLLPRPCRQRFLSVRNTRCARLHVLLHLKAQPHAWGLTWH